MNKISSNEYQYLLSAGLAGSRQLLKYFGQSLKKTYKSSVKDIVTKADIASQQDIIKSLQQNCSMIQIKSADIGIIGEEKDAFHLARDTFIIDPLDSTSSFVAGEESFCLSIAHAVNQEIVSGIIIQPTKNIIYFGQKGAGSWKIYNNRKQKLIINRLPLDQITVGYNLPKDTQLAIRMYQLAIKLLPQVYHLRQSPSGVLTLAGLAENRFGAVINLSTRIWDLAAAGLIINQAGGFVYDLDGQLLTYDFNQPQKKYRIIATINSNINQLTKHVKKTE